ncbi:hypothetical protein K469DRAFT_790679 [Zopfia rhizophila CBS 207.26]|uniref:Uncharacterized protein n=1 Tax=Zopfia rhizophila CBS 207.26 TaxID=1314779 RepID=A0A6A6DR07_9PEZI|nr:hypothetical protein K469DRAFT_790679 [Zopfia rhizophila CBS 207.26]
MTMYEYQIPGPSTGRSKRKTKSFFKIAIKGMSFLKIGEGNFATDYSPTIVSWQNLHESIQGYPCKGDGRSGGSEWGPITFTVGQSRKTGKDIVLTVQFQLLRKVEFNKFRGLLADEKEMPSKSLWTISGYFYTVKLGIGRILLNVNVATGALFRPIKVTEFVSDKETFSGHVKTICESSEDSATDPGVNSMENLRRCELRAVNLGTREDKSWFAPDHLLIVEYRLYRRPVPAHMTS